MMIRYALSLTALTAGISLSSCATLNHLFDETGVVEYYSNIPEECNTVRGLTQSVVKQVDSEQQLVDHYGLSFHVWFQDGVSPELFGALYYQNRNEGKYCMALPDGEFAVFYDSMIGHKPNVSHEVCYPLKDCRYNPFQFSQAQ